MFCGEEQAYCPAAPCCHISAALLFFLTLRHRRVLKQSAPICGEQQENMCSLKKKEGSTMAKADKRSRSYFFIIPFLLTLSVLVMAAGPVRADID
ncbi:MAG: hypothetical protein D3904_16230, partial [Candidatus Electrothrix sp. EH2]|nr:hypothetical protein [Candidatus Electrothrix sp. EH2]